MSSSQVYRVGVKWKELPPVTFADQLEGKYIVSSLSLHVYLLQAEWAILTSRQKYKILSNAH